MYEKSSRYEYAFDVHTMYVVYVRNVYDRQCTMYTVQRTMYSVQRTRNLYNVRLFSVTIDFSMKACYNVHL